MKISHISAYNTITPYKNINFNSRKNAGNPGKLETLAAQAAIHRISFKNTQIANAIKEMRAQENAVLAKYYKILDETPKILESSQQTLAKSRDYKEYIEEQKNKFECYLLDYLTGAKDNFIADNGAQISVLANPENAAGLRIIEKVNGRQSSVYDIKDNGNVHTITVNNPDGSIDVITREDIMNTRYEIGVTQNDTQRHAREIYHYLGDELVLHLDDTLKYAHRESQTKVRTAFKDGKVSSYIKNQHTDLGAEAIDEFCQFDENGKPSTYYSQYTRCPVNNLICADEVFYFKNGKPQEFIKDMRLTDDNGYTMSRFFTFDDSANLNHYIRYSDYERSYPNTDIVLVKGKIIQITHKGETYP